jgi:hypothetical protein
MGIFPGAKVYFRERCGAFRSSLDGTKRPNVVISDLMLTMYMFDAYCNYTSHRSGAGAGTLRSLAAFLWSRIISADGERGLARWQTHVVTFDIGGRSPRAKEPTQKKRSTAAGVETHAAPAAYGYGPDEAFPSPFSGFLRTSGAVNRVVFNLVPLLKREYARCISACGTVIIQHADGPTLLRKEGLEVVEERMWHAACVCDIGEGDMSVCYWVQYFNAESTLVISKDTDMLLLLGLVCPSRPRSLILRLDYQLSVDYIDIFLFRQWVSEKYLSYLDGFLYITMQGNDYVQKVSKGCGATVMLDELQTAIRRVEGTCTYSDEGVFSLDERLLTARLSAACKRGRLHAHVPVLVRQGWWYLYYSLTAVNGMAAGCNACITPGDSPDQSLFGWLCDSACQVRVAEKITPTPCFSIVVSESEPRLRPKLADVEKERMAMKIESLDAIPAFIHSLITSDSIPEHEIRSSHLFDNFQTEMRGVKDIRGITNNRFSRVVDSIITDIKNRRKMDGIYKLFPDKETCQANFAKWLSR